MNFIDLHSHITWNVDDGIQTQEETLEAIKMAKKDGIQTIALTPHFIPGRFDQSDYDEITENMQACIACCNEQGIQAVVGSELFLNEDYLDMLDQQLFYSINQTKYVLVEFDVRKEMNRNDSAEEKLYEILLRGYVPIIAHVERYFHETLDLKRVKEWVNMGCLIQVNRTSLLGGKQSNKHAIQLIKNNFVHLVATDTHASTGNRISKMSDCYDYLRCEYSKETADLLCFENPQHILLGEDVEVTQNKVKKSFLSRILGRE